jgi:hypothetical protein
MAVLLVRPARHDFRGAKPGPEDPIGRQRQDRAQSRRRLPPERNSLQLLSTGGGVRRDRNGEAGTVTPKNAIRRRSRTLLSAVTFNADAVRTNLPRDLGFSHENRIEQPGMDVATAWSRRGHRDSRFCLPHAGDARCIWRRLHYLGGLHQRGPRYRRRAANIAANARSSAAPELDPQEPTALFVGRGHYILINGADTALDPAREVGDWITFQRHGTQQYEQED